MKSLYAIGLSLALSLFIATNAILVFKEDSTISRSYYIDTHKRVTEGEYSRHLEKEAVTIPSAGIELSIDRGDVESVVVKTGDTVTLGDTLVLLDTSERDAIRAEWDAKVGAYQLEQRDLQSILSSLRTAKSRSNATSSSTGSANTSGFSRDEVIDFTVNLDVNVEIPEDATYDQAIAQVETQIAKIERELSIVQAQLASTSENLEFVSPIDGFVEQIEEFETQLVFHIVPSEQTLVTFVEEKHWHEIEAAQPVQAYSTHLAKSYAAQVAGKGTMPVTDNRWKEIHGQFEQHPDLPLYEIQVTPAEPLEGLPFGANVNTIITIDQATGAMRLRDDWTITRNKEYAEIYSISAEGKIGRIPVTIAFDMPETQSVIVDDGLVNGQIVLDDTFRRNNARTFFPQPLELPSWATVKALGWKDYMAFLIQKPYVPNTEEDVEEEVDTENSEN
ncbi:hypothetical protein ACF3OH_10975 [Chryseomicrobium aureum]|uniref:hypothetical protein n=1 Tax=Chryseomicrobium aureum TaxID=1441723 RepID=UPI00370D12EE